MGLSLISPDININFVGAGKIALVASLLLVGVGLVSLVAKGGPRYGIDFAGGVMVQVSFKSAMDAEGVKAGLAGGELDDVVIQRIGMATDNDFLIRIPAADGHTTNDIRQIVTQAFQGTEGFDIQRLEMVGPKVGADLRDKALQALFYAVLFIAIYISGRFEQRWWAAGIMAAGLAGGMYGLDQLGVPLGYLPLAAIALALGLCWYLKLNYALGAVVALIHDVIITVGLFSLMDKEFDLTVVAALLTIVGYSLNDTIIVFDRIRENIRAKFSDVLEKIINRSINQTLSRTLLTSGTTLVVVLALYLLGGGVIHDFALALLIGIGVGTYSSIFVASPILLAFSPDMSEGDEEGEGAGAPAQV